MATSWRWFIYGNTDNGMGWRHHRKALTAIISFGLVILAIFLLFEWRYSGGLTGVPLDDSWIHYRFADNLRKGQGFSFNPGEPTAGSTAPLWVALLSLAGNGYLLPSKMLGMLAYLGVGVMVYLLCMAAGLRWGYSIVAGISSLAAGRLVWAAPSGMETTAFTLVSLIALWYWRRNPENRIPFGTSLLFGLACLLRPEGMLLVGLSAGEWFIRDQRSSARFMTVIKHLIIAGLVVSPYIAFSYVSGGHLLPNTFYVKSSTWNCEPGAAYYLWTGLVFLLDNPVMTLLASAGVVWILWSQAWKSESLYSLGGLWFFGLLFLNGLLAPCVSGYYTRYTTPLIPFVMIFGALGGQRLAEWAKEKIKIRVQKSATSMNQDRLAQILLFEGVGLALIPTLFFWAPYYAQSVVDIQTMHIQIGEWLAVHSQPEEVIALNDVGAIGSIAGREVIDLMGLTTPEVLALVEGKAPGEWDQALTDYLLERKPAYLAVFPNWFPKLIIDLPLEPVFQVELSPRSIAGIPQITVAGGGKMIVYRFHWGNSR